MNVPAPAEVEAFLAGHHRRPVTGLERLACGFWSAAFAYEVAGRALVVRLGEVREGFEMDRLAMAFDGPDLPVPEVLDVGEAFGGAYAISARHHGRFLEDVRPEEALVAGPALERLLGALRAVPAEPGAPSTWYPPGPPTWRDWLLAGLVDDPSRRVSGWRARLAADADLDRLYRRCESRIGELLPACPELRDLVHGDLLHGNVLVAEDASAVTAVFSWKCSVRGDFLYDVAWCTFWAPWHHGIEAVGLWDRTQRSDDAALRHHCYELHIGATHLGWNAWAGDEPALRAVAARTEEVLARGPA